MSVKLFSLSGASFVFGLGVATIGCRTTEFADPAPEIARMEAAQAEAIKQNVDVLSPGYFKDSAEELQRAKESNAKGKDPSEQLKDARVDLEKAVESAKPVRTALQETLTIRSKALAANAPYFEPDAWDKAEKMLKQSTDDAGKGDLRKVEKSKDELTMMYSNLEGDAIVGARLNKAKNTFAQAEEDDAKKYAPETFRKTKEFLEQQEQAIRTDRHNSPILETALERSTAAADRLVRISSEAKRLGSEKVALEMEAKDLKNAASQAVAGRKLATEKVASAKAEAEAADATEKLATADQQLSDQKAMEQKLMQAKAKFSGADADIMEDGRNILIRLKGLNFKVGSSDLASANQSLVAKVAEVIAMYGQPMVKVEGHSDSTGSKATNIRLSDERAKAVKAALIRDSGLPEAKITAEGYGDTRPVANNKSAAGRSQNRRVDVIITPEAPLAH